MKPQSVARLAGGLQVGGAENAALLAVEILALSDPALRGRLQAYRDAMTRSIEDDESNAGLRGER